MELSGSPLRVGRPNTIMAMGDSVTANGYTAGTVAQFVGGDNYLAWASLLSRGRLILPSGPIAATGGYTSAQILATHLPTVLAARPGFCVVIAGGNDANSAQGDITTTVNNLTAIYDSLRAAQIMPVCCTYVPGQNLSSWGRQRLNEFVRRYAAVNGCPFVDVFSILGDPAGSGTYLNDGTYNADSVHPNAYGAKVIGQRIAEALDPYLTPYAPPLAQINTFGANDTINKITNPLLLTDTNADGQPDGWTTDFGTPATNTLTTHEAVRGSVYQITRGASDASVQYYTGAAIPVTAGNRMVFACRVAATVKSVGGVFRVRLQKSDSTTVLVGLQDYTEDVPIGSVLAVEFVVPSGFTGLRLHMTAGTASGAAVSVGQVTLLDYTAAGIA